MVYEFRSLARRRDLQSLSKSRRPETGHVDKLKHIGHFDGRDAG